MTEEHLIKDEIFGDDLEQVWLVAEAPLRNIAEQLADLHSLKGAGFISMLKEITQQRAFSPLEGESNIYTTGGTKDDDYDNLLISYQPFRPGSAGCYNRSRPVNQSRRSQIYVRL